MFNVILDQSWRLAKIVFGHSGPSISYRTIWRLPICVYSNPGYYFDKWFQFSIFSNLVRFLVLPFYNSLVIIWYFVLDISVVRQCQRLQYLPSSVGLCLFASLSQWIDFLRSRPIASYEVVRTVLRCLELVVWWYGAVPARYRLKIFSFGHMTINVIDRVFTRRVCHFFWDSLPLVFVRFVISFVAWFVLLVY